MLYFTVTCLKVFGGGALPLVSLEHEDGSSESQGDEDQGGRLVLLPSASASTSRSSPLPPAAVHLLPSTRGVL